MSDRDPLEQLSAFGTGGPVNPLPAPEVRRLGDRRRARRTAVSAVAGATAVLAVAIPAGLFATRGGDAAPGPGTSSSATTTPTTSATPSLSPDAREATSIGRGDIPGDLPLGIGAIDFGSEGDSRGPAADVGVDGPDLCGTRGLAAARATGRIGFVNTGIEYVEQRELRTYPDPATAAAVVERLRDEVAACRSFEAEGPVTVTVLPIRAETGYDSVTFAEAVEPYAVGFQVTRVGRAVLLLREGGEWTVDAIASTAADQLTERTRTIAPHLCAFTQKGCDDAAPDTATGSTGGFGPSLGGLRLGEGQEEVTSAGWTLTGSGDDCRGLLPPAGGHLEQGMWQDGVGVASINDAMGEGTPEGIKVGASVDEVLAAYPDASLDGDDGAAAGLAVEVALEGPGRWMIVVHDSEVMQISLVHDDLTCTA